MHVVKTEPSLDLGRFSMNPDHSYTLPASCYFDPAVYESEKAAVFHRSWIFVGAANSLPQAGSYATIDVAGQNIAIVRGRDLKVRAFYNVCSHRAHELLRGSGQTRRIVCPYHSWTYELDGQLRSNKIVGGVGNFDTKEFCLKAVQVEEFLGFLFVNLDPAARSLRDQTAGLEAEIRRYCPEPEKLKFAARLTFEVKANWKTVADNFQECYHCPATHPQFVQLVEHEAYRVRAFGIVTSHLAPARPGGGAYKFDAQAPQAALNYAGWYLWPNVALNVFPGPPNMSFLRIMPTGPETALEHWDFYLAGDTPSSEEQASIDYIEKVLQPEDISIVESVQRGLHSKGYHQGRFVVNAERDAASEHGVHYFQSLWSKAMRGTPPG